MENWCNARPLPFVKIQSPALDQAPVEGEGLMVSFLADVPEALLASMLSFI